jgi:16S rRNA (cytosine1402-N4)-methyltransferase
MTDGQPHNTVLLEQAVDALVVDKNGIYLDCTFGRGGHTRQLLTVLKSKGRVLALDRDPEAIAKGEMLATMDRRFSIHYCPFSKLGAVLETHGVNTQLSGVLFDLGISSPQLDQPERGFSFMQDGPLDMRMDTSSGQTAETWIGMADEHEIADVLYQFGEEKFSRRIASAIVAARQEQAITRTLQLAAIVKRANPAWERDKHPATRSFQAIRIFINKELQELNTGLQQALEGLSIGGRLVVISFHSLEDRIVKKFISLQTKGDSFPKRLPIRQSQLNPRLKKLGKAVRVSETEIRQNPRSRSAVMRVAEKIA